MSIVRVSLVEGFNEFQKADLMDRLTDAVQLGVGVPRENVTVIIDVIPGDNYRRGGEPSPAPPPALPQAVVREFANAMRHGNVELARAYTAPEFTALSLSGALSGGIDDAANWAAPHFRKVVKTYDSFEEAAMKDGSVAVYGYGSLTGERADGTPFVDIPFIDRFTVYDGKLFDQQTWCNFIAG